MSQLDDLLHRFLAPKGHDAQRRFELVQIPFGGLVYPGFSSAVLYDQPAFKHISDRALNQFLLIYVSRLAHNLSAQLFTEFAAHRSVHRQLEGSDEGAFGAFTRWFIGSGLADFLDRFPQAKFLVAHTILQCQNYLNFLCDCLRDDRVRLVGDGLLNSNSVVGEIEQLSDDFHYDGKCVLLLKFVSGQRLVFKPRNGFFEELLHKTTHSRHYREDWGNLFFPKSANYGDHSYSQHIEQPLFNPSDIETYYRNAGRVLFLLQTLQVTDVHYENLIADKCGPRIVDLETCLYPLLRQEFTIFEQSRSDLKVQDVLACSVMAVGLLPAAAQIRPGEFVKMGGLENVVRFERRLHFRNPNTDKMQRSEQKTETRFNNVPFLSDRAVPLEQHADPFLSGYQEARCWDQNHPEMFENLFAELEGAAPKTRFILRPTALYDQILLRATSTELASNSSQFRANIQEQLIKSSPGSLWNSSPILEYETDCIELGDVPIFYVNYDSANLYSVSNKRLAEDMFEDTPRDRLLRARELNASSDVRLLNDNIIRALTGLKPKKLPDASRFNVLDIESASLESAHTICDAAIVSEDFYSWIVASSSGPYTAPVIQTAGNDLYTGNTGIALALAAVYRRTQNRRFLHFSKGAVAHLRELSGDRSWLSRSIELYGYGAFEGLGSLIFGLSALAKILDDNEYLNLANRLIGNVELRSIEKNQRLDVVSGLAGLLMALLFYERQSAHRDLLTDFVGEELLRKFDKADTDNIFGFGTCLPTGFSHGLSGLGLAFARMGSLRQSDRFTEASIRCLEREDLSYVKDQRNWKDGRAGAKKMQSTWCHGSLGISTSRYEIARLLGRSRDFIVSTPEFTFECEFDHLCCGKLGEIECAIKSRRFCETSPVLRKAQRSLEEIALRVGNGASLSWPNGSGIFSPSLMSGAAGLVYTIERWLDRSLPSILFLD